MIGSYGIDVTLFERNVTSSTNGTPIESLAPWMSSYSHTIKATGGFEKLIVACVMPLELAFDQLNRLLCPIEATGPDAQTLWEGFVSGVTLQIGQEEIDLSVDDLANAVRVRYQPDIGAQIATAFATDATSIAAYGRKDYIYSGSGMTTAAAEAVRNVVLALRSSPVSRRSSQAGIGVDEQDIAVRITGSGWITALGYLVTANSVTATAVTTQQVQNLTDSFLLVNPWISNNYSDITDSGISDTQYIEDDTPYLEKIERLMSIGNSAGHRLAYGIYEYRRWRIQAAASATPNILTYQRNIGEGFLRDAGGAIIQPWDVRPDAMYEVNEFVPTFASNTAVDTAARYYLERVTCAVESTSASVRLEPSQSSELDVLLARIRN